MNLPPPLVVELPALRLYQVVLLDAVMPLVVFAPMWVSYAIEPVWEEEEKGSRVIVPPEVCGGNWVTLLTLNWLHVADLWR